MNEKQQLEKDIAELEAQLKVKTDRLYEILHGEAQEIEEHISMAKRGIYAFDERTLRFAATARCVCGAGMAYPKGATMHGAWHCSAILTGKAASRFEEGAKSHSSPMPFAFYEVKSENQPSANGQTTRPKE